MGLDHYRDASRKSRNDPYEATYLFHPAVSSGDTLIGRSAQAPDPADLDRTSFNKTISGPGNDFRLKVDLQRSRASRQNEVSPKFERASGDEARNLLPFLLYPFFQTDSVSYPVRV